MSLLVFSTSIFLIILWLSWLLKHLRFDKPNSKKKKNKNKFAVYNIIGAYSVVLKLVSSKKWKCYFLFKEENSVLKMFNRHFNPTEQNKFSQFLRRAGCLSFVECWDVLRIFTMEIVIIMYNCSWYRNANMSNNHLHQTDCNS